MKTILSALIISVLLTSSASANQKNKKRGVNIDQVIASLQLEGDKATNLRTLMENHHTDRESLRKQGQKNREQRHELREKHRQELLKVLGYEKMYEFEEIMRQNRQKRKQHKKH